MSEIWQLSATELAQRIAKRELSSVEVGTRIWRASMPSIPR